MVHHLRQEKRRRNLTIISLVFKNAFFIAGKISIIIRVSRTGLGIKKNPGVGGKHSVIFIGECKESNSSECLFFFGEN